MKKLLKKVLQQLGYTVHKTTGDYQTFSDIKNTEFWEIYKLCKPYTMTSIERMYSLYNAVDYILTNDIKGAFVECGVWRGGSAMLIAKMLSNRNISDRKIYLYDTFKGMSEPTDKDITIDGKDAKESMIKSKQTKETSVWCLAELPDVKRNLQLTNYQENNIYYVEGKVEDTLPNSKPSEEIALLRLDTDWYESTKHELTFLYPELVHGGVLIIDDFGYWQGCHKAVIDYFKDKGSILFNRIDNNGRIAIKTSAKNI